MGLADKKLGLFLGPVEALRAAFPKITISINRHEVLDIAEGPRAEFGHMLKGIVGIDRENMQQDQWQTLARISIEQMQVRIRMRNARFSYPLGGEKLAIALAGRCAPLKFDYERAGLVG